MRGLLAVTVTLGILTAACSSGDPEEVVAPTSAPAATAAPTAAPEVTDTTEEAEPTATPAPTTPPEIDACEIVDEVDATGVLGSEATIDESAGAGLGCAWITDSGALLVVTLATGSQFFPPAEPGAEPLDIGDESWILVEETFGGVQVHVLQAEWALSLSVTPFGVADIENLPARVTAAAERAADRLP